MRRLAVLFALVIALVPGIAAAQNAPEIDTLFVELWPEYDRAAMLVIYRIQLSEQTTLPTTIAVRIPAAVGEPNAVAEVAAAGGLVNTAYERQVEGEWATLLIQTTTGIVQVEYYDPALTKDGAVRTYSDVLEFDYPIGRLLVRVQQPPTASNMQITPTGTPAVEGDGLTYFYSEFGAVPAGETIEISVAYEKDDDALTVGSLAPAPAPEEPAPSANGKQALAWGLGILGAVIIGYAGFRLWQDNRAANERVTPRGRRGSAGATGVGKTVFCHNCGTKSKPSDRYCRECGTELRMG
ncbi:MAG: zinc ribbon domain-containing protein [Anaerolineae bacterium]|nr:MAG: zinc ribbon domain-containing protein [Anaerolineae bacterium]